MHMANMLQSMLRNSCHGPVCGLHKNHDSSIANERGIHLSLNQQELEVMMMRMVMMVDGLFSGQASERQKVKSRPQALR